MVGPAVAAETIVTTAGEKYEKATISRSEPDGLIITHSAGVAKIPYEQLPPGLQTRYHFDPGAAAQFRQQLDEAAANHRQRVDEAAAARAKEIAAAQQAATELNTDSATSSPTSMAQSKAPDASRAPRDESAELFQLKPGEDLLNITSYTVKEFEANKLKLVGRIIRLSFTMRDTNPRQSRNATFYTSKLYDTPFDVKARTQQSRMNENGIHPAVARGSATVRFPAYRLSWFSDIVDAKHQVKASYPRVIYGRVTQDRDRIVLDLLGTEIFTDFHGPKLIWR